VEGAKRWYASPQGLITPKAVAVATQKARDELDHVQQWLEECAEPSIGGDVTNAALYSSYLHWCEENGQPPKKANAFGRALSAKGYEAASKKVAGRTARVYLNLALT
jgi:phage/plasmid-associated DNA primase